MTLVEIERMLKMAPTELRQHLEDELLIKQRKSGLIDVDVMWKGNCQGVPTER